MRSPASPTNVLLRNPHDRGEYLINANYYVRCETNCGSDGGIVVTMSDGKVLYVAGTVRTFLASVQMAAETET